MPRARQGHPQGEAILALGIEAAGSGERAQGPHRLTDGGDDDEANELGVTKRIESSMTFPSDPRTLNNPQGETAA